MNTLYDHIAVARRIAAQREGDIRIQEFLRAMKWEQMRGEGTRSDERVAFTIECHARSWYRQLSTAETESLRSVSAEELAAMFADWIAEALSKGLLSLSNPPISGAAEPLTAAAVVTYIYDRERGCVGMWWESRARE